MNDDSNPVSSSKEWTMSFGFDKLKRKGDKLFNISQRPTFGMIYAENINLLLSHEYSTNLASESMMPLNKIYHF